MPVVSCPACGEHDRLAGVDRCDDKLLRCEACGHEWRRSLTPTCRLCGSTDLEAVPTSTLEEAGRGNMRTPSGIRDLYHCFACDARDATSSAARRPDPVSTAPSLRNPGAMASPLSPRGRVAPSRERVESEFGIFETGAVVGGRWRLTLLLHWGSTGSVWAAQDAAGSGRGVTFKLVHPGEPTTAAHAASARALVEVRHPSLHR